jgi:hypothetical protein
VTKVIDSLTDSESIQSANVLLHPVTNTIKTTPSTQANAHSIYFASVSHKPCIESLEQPAFNAMKQQVHDYLHRPDDSPDAKPFSMKELKSALKKLHDKRATGYDNISAEALHCLHRPVLRVILQLANRIWELGELPSSFRCSIIIPILEEGKPPKECLSYQPIALASILSKLIERLVVTHLTYRLEHDGILSAIQS